MVAAKPSLSPRAARAALTASLDRRIRSDGELSFPAAPALLELYMRRLLAMFASMGKVFSRAERTALREMLAPRLNDGFARSPHSRVHIKWQAEPPPGAGIDYTIWLETGTVEAEYEDWAASRQPPLFGAGPDAKLLHVAEALTPPNRHRILDIGAGTGRNTLALARAGFSVDALEPTPAFCKMLRRVARAERASVEVIEGSLFATKLDIPRARYSLILCSEVTSHFRGVDELRTLFERCARWLRPGGSLLLNAFVAEPGLELDLFTREVSQLTWSTVFTRQELARATRGLCFSRLSDESAHAYEKAHQAPEHWPPTSWYESWSRGLNCYRVDSGVAPMELRWLHYRKLSKPRRTGRERLRSE
ncbi:MAG TPA: class I SAM-dependent methyltransferase [Polyangiaceae bacterium]|nr:class I SAM-dependent methyltransferase [Polyangiaceae bacterium]